MLALTVTITGATDGDIALALEEVLRSVAAGNTSGLDSNETGAYRFEMTGTPDEIAEEG